MALWASIATKYLVALGIVREPTVWGFITSKYIFDEKLKSKRL